MSTVQTRPAAFDAIATQYDDLFTNSLIGRAQRDAVWDVVRKHLRDGSFVLELNCGTGEDACFLAKCGMDVVATDVSEKMIEVARRRASHESVSSAVEFRALAIEDLAKAFPLQKFDAAFSNFSGLNCVNDLRQTAVDLAGLLPGGSPAILCFSNKYCVWETVWYLLRGQGKKAFRRCSSKPVTARIGGEEVVVLYPSIGAIGTAFAPHFRVIRILGVGITVPPSYLEPWMRRLPRALGLFRRVDRVVRNWPGFRALGDHVVLVMERTTS